METMNRNKSTVRLPNIYRGMLSRCSDPHHPSYKNYGGRGIIVDDEWLHDANSFYDWALDNGYSDDLELDRIDVNGGYCAENCRWIDRKAQMRNIRRNVYVIYKGEKVLLVALCEKYGVNYVSVYKRISRGRPFDLESMIYRMGMRSLRKQLAGLIFFSSEVRSRV